MQVEQDGATKSYRARFLFFGSGYYNYDEPYVPEFSGIENFEGTVVNPQHWPEDLDYSDKRVVVIGSGATAVTLVPALSQRAAKVVMLQRSPTYIFPGARVNGLIQFVRNTLPRKVSHWFARWYAAIFEGVVWFLSQKFPAMMRRFIRSRAVANLPSGYPVDVHFNPRYNPWDQRLCLDADGDLFNAVSSGRVEIITDQIDRFDATGIWLKSGRHLTADIVATATGLQLQASAEPESAWTAPRSSRRTATSTRPICSRTCPTWPGAWATPTPPDAARRHDRRALRQAGGLHGRARLQPRLPAPGR